MPNQREPTVRGPAAHRTTGALGRALSEWLRRDSLPLALFAIATAAMTWPILGNLDGLWLASHDKDTYAKLWDNWWFATHAFPDLSFTQSDLLFHPIGLDLSYHSISWTVASSSAALGAVVDRMVVYNLSILVAVFGNAYGAYLLIRTMVDQRAGAVFGGLVYGFAPYALAHSGGHPDLSHLAAIPLTALLTIQAIERVSVGRAVAAAVLLSLASFTSLYIMVFTMLTAAPLALHTTLAKQHWRAEGFWRVPVAIGVVCAVPLGIRLAPILFDADGLSFAIESKYRADSRQTDLLSLVTPSRFHPVFGPLVAKVSAGFGMNRKWPAYLGALPLFLSLFALARSTPRARVVLWLSIGIGFVLLGLGPVLRLNGHVYEWIPLPGALVAGLPPIRAIGRPDYFILGALLPLAVVAALGLDRVLRDTSGRTRAVIATAACAALLFEYSQGPYRGAPERTSPFLHALGAEPDGGALIDIPMGRGPSKRYMYLQSIHGRPIAEGISGRMPANAYRYVDANYLLAHWRRRVHPPCDAESVAQTGAALDQLASDGFEFVVVHHDGMSPKSPFAKELGSGARFQDEFLTAYEVETLRTAPPCRAEEQAY